MHWARLSGMDNERIRAICMGLPHVAETLNWGHYLVYWAGDREVGGKMFALADLDGSGAGVLSFHCGAERYHELLENDGIVPAPHLARAHWVMLERWDALRPREIEEELRRAHALTLEKLPKRTRAILESPGEEKKLVRKRSMGRKKVLAARVGESSSGTASVARMGGAKRKAGKMGGKKQAEPARPGERM